MDDDEPRGVLAERREPPSASFRALVTSTLLAGRRKRRISPRLPVVAIVVLAFLLVAVLSGSCAVLQQRSSNAPASSPGIEPGLPVKVAMTGGGEGWGLVVVSASQVSQPLQVAVTTDSGTHWRSVLKLAPGNVPYLQGFDRRGAVLIWYPPSTGKGGAEPNKERLYSTADGGRTWRSEPLPANTATLQAVSFISPDEGWFLGSDRSSPSSRFLWHTSDAGKSWQRLGDASDALTIRFIDSRTGWIGRATAALGVEPDLRVTRDGGRTWVPVHLLLPPASSGYPGITSLVGVEPAGASALVAVLTVGVGSQGVGAPVSLVVYVSSDGGATWSAPALAWSGKTALLGGPSFAAASGTTWIVAFGDHALLTADGGRAWNISQLPVAGGYRAADAGFTGASEGFILALPLGTCFACSGILLTTNDGGRSWRATSGVTTATTPAAATASVSPPGSASGQASRQFPTRCFASDLRLDLGQQISEPTGQHTLSLALTNTSVGCHLFGYPGISLIDASGNALPLEYVHTRDQVVTGEEPGWVDLEPSATAYVTVNKYRCDTRTIATATSLRLLPPDDNSALQISILGSVSMAYCGAGDPGSIVHVSPVEPSFAATLSHP